MARTKHTALKKRSAVQRETIVIFGMGRSGIATAAAAAAAGLRVIGFEQDEVRRAQIEARTIDFLDREDAAQFSDARAISLTADETRLRTQPIRIFILSNPIEDGRRLVPDTAALEAAAEIAGRHVTTGALVVVESVALLGFSEGALLPLILKASRLARDEFYFACVPARAYDLDSHSVREAARVVGATSEAAQVQALELYRSLTAGPLIPLASAKEAEAVYLAEAAGNMLATAVGAEFAALFERAGIDSRRSLDALALLSGYGAREPELRAELALEELLRFGRERKLALHLLRAARNLAAQPKHFGKARGPGVPRKASQ